MMTPIQVIGIGLDGAVGLSSALQTLVMQADLLVGSPRHLAYFPQFPAERWILTDLRATLLALKERLTQPQPGLTVILTSGDPLFFGLGRLITELLPPEVVTFHPHASSLQLAFNRLKLPWHDAQWVSLHGRSEEVLVQVLKQGAEKIGVLTDHVNTPSAIARLIQSLALSTRYILWVCENLGGQDECIRSFTPETAIAESFASLNVVVLLRQPSSVQPSSAQPLTPSLVDLPLIGLADPQFLSFDDRPGLMTKREVRVLALAELALQDRQVIWDVGAGTGSVSVEIARLCPTSQIYAIEKTAAGIHLIERNCHRFGVSNIRPVQGMAPEALAGLPQPDRVFIGGSSGQLASILTTCQAVLPPGGLIVLALATLENLAEVMVWIDQQSPSEWQTAWLQVQISRSTAIGSLTRWSPLNPVTLVRLMRQP